jgi:hypothetical protein
MELNKIDYLAYVLYEDFINKANERLIKNGENYLYGLDTKYNFVLHKYEYTLYYNRARKLLRKAKLKELLW